MKRHQLSGAQKRKLKKSKEEDRILISGAILKFVQQQPSTFNSNIEYPTPSRVCCEEAKSMESLSPQIQEETIKLVQRNLGDTFPLKVSASNYKYLDKDREETLADFDEQYVIEDEPDIEISDEVSNVPLYCNIGNWPVPLSDVMQTDFVKRGSEFFQNKEGPFGLTMRIGENLKGEMRQLSSTWFYKYLPCGEKVLRKWMVYSPIKKSLFCFCCKLFCTNTKEAGTSKFITGFQSWWKLNPMVAQHESSAKHLENLEIWKSLSVRLKLNKTIDSMHQKEVEKEKIKWNKILHRLLDITLFLAKQNLPFRGHREDEQSFNRGNFLELVELISHYDPVLKRTYSKNPTVKVVKEVWSVLFISEDSK